MREAPEYDVAIVGGGPAGAAAALSLMQLRPKLRVAVVEASRYSAWRAGETLSPGCRQILSGLGCWDSFRGAGFMESFGTRAVWGAPEPYDNEFLFSLRGNGWHVDRVRFDALLCGSAKQAGADVIEDARLRVAAYVDRSFRLRLRGTELHPERGELRARFVIDASGREACFATGAGARRITHDRLIGVCGLFPSAGPDAATLVEAQSEGWWYSALLPGSRVVVAWMSDVDLIRDREMCRTECWLEGLGRSEWTRARVSGDLQAPLRVWAAYSQRLSQFCGDGWLAAGDAATTYDPLSSQGILKALRAGKIASFVALDALEGRDSASRYEKLVAAEYADYLETRRWFYSQEQRWPQSPFWRRRYEVPGR